MHVKADPVQHEDVADGQSGAKEEGRTCQACQITHIGSATAEWAHNNLE